jgi:hypothetical protein
MNEATLHHRNFLLHLQELAGYEQPVLIKEPAREEPAPSHIAQLHNEYAVTKRLNGARALQRSWGGLSSP